MFPGTQGHEHPHGEVPALPVAQTQELSMTFPMLSRRGMAEKKGFY